MINDGVDWAKAQNSKYAQNVFRYFVLYKVVLHPKEVCIFFCPSSIKQQIIHNLPLRVIFITTVQDDQS